ncbi:MAG: hypothetical protein WCC60_02275 [Ilumatobacteraceae bacterium]
MLYQLSYDHHEGMQCAIRGTEFHHAFRWLPVQQRVRAIACSASVHDGFRGELGLPERNPEETSHERNGKHSHA